MLDKIIINGAIIDDSGAPARIGSFGIKNGKIILDPKNKQAVEAIDAKGKVVCPGFIDAHSHGDSLIGTEDGRLFRTVQGITTELCGQCGGYRRPWVEIMLWKLLPELFRYIPVMKCGNGILLKISSPLRKSRICLPMPGSM